MSLERSFLISAIVALTTAGYQYFSLKNKIDDPREMWSMIAKNSGFSFIIAFVASYSVLNGALDSMLSSMSSGVSGVSASMKSSKMVGGSNVTPNMGSTVKTDMGNI
jgi:hypothetical protein